MSNRLYVTMMAAGKKEVLGQHPTKVECYLNMTQVKIFQHKTTKDRSRTKKGTLISTSVVTVELAL